MALVESNRNCLQKPRKPILPLTTLDKIFRRRYVKNTQFYFTNRIHAQGEGKLDYRCPLKGPRHLALVSYIRYSDRRSKLYNKRNKCAPIYMKYGQKFDKIKDLSQRAYVPEPPDDVKCVRGIHPEFNTVVSGRPLRSSGDINIYIQNIRDYAMLRQQIGYRKDLICRIQRNISDEATEYKTISCEVKKHLLNFQRFLLEDNKSVEALVDKLGKLSTQIQDKNDEFLSIVSSITVLNNIIFELDTTRQHLKILRTYCLFVAPINWRQQYDETLRDRLQSIQFESGAFSFDSDDLMQCIDTYKTLESAEIELKNPLPPVLYFNDPQQMIDKFHQMELQSRNYLIELSKTCAPYRFLLRSVNALKVASKQEIEIFQFFIDDLICATERENYNADYLQQKFLRILNDTFCNTVASFQTLKLKICIEFVYEQVLSKCEEGHHSLYDSMTVLEGLYENYYMQLEGLDFDVVKCAQQESFSQDLKNMKRARLAQRELKAFKGMTEALKVAYMPPAKFKKSPSFGAQPLGNSAVISKSRTIDKKKDLTEDDRDGLLFFTEWIEGTDPTPYLPFYRDQIKPLLIEAARNLA